MRLVPFPSQRRRTACTVDGPFPVRSDVSAHRADVHDDRGMSRVRRRQRVVRLLAKRACIHILLQMLQFYIDGCTNYQFGAPSRASARHTHCMNARKSGVLALCRLRGYCTCRHMAMSRVLTHPTSDSASWFWHDSVSDRSSMEGPRVLARTTHLPQKDDIAVAENTTFYVQHVYFLFCAGGR